MRTRLTASFACAFVCLGVAHAQFGRGTPEWGTAGGDAHRSSSVPADPKISKESLSKPGFALFWKMKLNNEARQLNALMPPTLMDRHIGIHGFRSFGFVTGSGDNVYAVDTDLARIDWQKNFGGKAPADASLTCPGGMTTGTAHRSARRFLRPRRGRGRRTRRGGRQERSRRTGRGRRHGGGAGEAARPRRRADPGRGGGRGGGGGDAGRACRWWSIRSPATACSTPITSPTATSRIRRSASCRRTRNAQGLIIVDNVAYVATVGGCGGVANGVWALDIASKAVTSWKPHERRSGRVRRSGVRRRRHAVRLHYRRRPGIARAKDAEGEGCVSRGAGAHVVAGGLPAQGEDDDRGHHEGWAHPHGGCRGDGRRGREERAVFQRRAISFRARFPPGRMRRARAGFWRRRRGRCRADAKFSAVEWRRDQRRGRGVEGSGAERRGGARAGLGVARSGVSVDSAGDQRRGVCGFQRGSPRQG